jgi:NADPH-dependent ferric siderophore reductase
MHGEGPAVRWAAGVRPGMTLQVTGPVVRHELAQDADWYLFAGDETAIPAIAGLLKDLVTTRPVRVFLEVKSADEKVGLEAPGSAEITWLFRAGVPAEESTLLHDAIQMAELPAGKGEVFLAGETARMREIRRSLLDRRLDREQVFAMGYWRPGRLGGDETIRD